MGDDDAETGSCRTLQASQRFYLFGASSRGVLKAGGPWTSLSPPLPQFPYLCSRNMFTVLAGFDDPLHRAPAWHLAQRRCPLSGVISLIATEPGQESGLQWLQFLPPRGASRRHGARSCHRAEHTGPSSSLLSAKAFPCCHITALCQSR